jgi:cephalosporin-C deacetylase-like acetyl esterase
VRHLSAIFPLLLLATPATADPLPNTKPLTNDGDLAAQMVGGIGQYLAHALGKSVETRKRFWKPDFSSPEAYAKSVNPNRERLRKILGAIDTRVAPVEIELVATTTQPALLHETADYRVFVVRWPVLPGVDGEGLLLEPKGKATANVVVIPDADVTPEASAGLAPGLPPRWQYARLLARTCRVVVPVLIDRSDRWSGNPKLGRMTNQPHREFVYRMSYEMGRHVIGYEVQKVLAAVDWMTRVHKDLPVRVVGTAEGGLIALSAAALDERIGAALVADYFGPREGMDFQPIYRNLMGFLREFGDAEMAALIAPRALVVVAAEDGGVVVQGPPPVRPGAAGAAPGRLRPFTAQLVESEIGRAERLFRGAEALIPFRKLADVFPELVEVRADTLAPPPARLKDFDPAPRQQRQFEQLCDFTQKVMRDSEARRAETFWAKLDTSSPEKYAASIAPFRKQLDEEIIGKLPKPTLPPDPKSRQIFDEPKYKGYEVTLDMYPGAAPVFAYGILLLPKDLKPGEKRPVVVCQHGLEGRPTDVINPNKKTAYYNSFGSALADRGYIVYAPQNPYIGHDDFRVLQRMANPLGLSLFSFIVRQHETTLDWLSSLPNVDPKRMAFYGLSYGGKTAMRVPVLVPRYCLSICSGDFNEWTWKNVSTDYRGSYMFSPEYEMPEFNLGSTLVYAEMAALIAPRPFMVERGHDDGVGTDEWVAYEYAKVRRLYSRLRIPERTAIEFFPGAHEIHLQGTAEFLQKHLNWPPR